MYYVLVFRRGGWGSFGRVRIDADNPELAKRQAWELRKKFSGLAMILRDEEVVYGPA